MLRRLTALVHDIEEGRRTQSLSTFLELAQQCRQSTTSAIG
jgi:hypothetical protein